VWGGAGLAVTTAIETELCLLRQQFGLSPASRSQLGYIQVKGRNALEEMVVRRLQRVLRCIRAAQGHIWPGWVVFNPRCADASGPGWGR
jgi:hypothetical protein